MNRIWDSFLSERDKTVLAAAGYGLRAGFGARPALIIVDVTYGFTGDRPEPILESIKRWKNSCGEESWQAVSVIAKLAKTFRDYRLPVIYSAGQAREDNWDACSWSWKNGRIEKKVEGPRQPGENDIVAELQPLKQDILILKQKPSAFYGTHLQSYLTYLGCDTLVVTGVSTSGCVRATVVDAFSANYRTVVVEDGCFDRSQASHAITLFDLDSKYSDIMKSEDVLAHISTLPRTLFPNLPRSE